MLVQHAKQAFLTSLLTPSTLLLVKLYTHQLLLVPIQTRSVSSTVMCQALYQSNMHFLPVCVNWNISCDGQSKLPERCTMCSFQHQTFTAKEWKNCLFWFWTAFRLHTNKACNPDVNTPKMHPTPHQTNQLSKRTLMHLVLCKWK